MECDPPNAGMQMVPLLLPSILWYFIEFCRQGSTLALDPVGSLVVVFMERAQ
jgi:hypothetical protein